MTYLETKAEQAVSFLKLSRKGLTVHTLATLMNLNYFTTRKALKQLEAEGHAEVMGFEPTRTNPRQLWAMKVGSLLRQRRPDRGYLNSKLRPRLVARA
jgi:hypothetical protein